MPIAEKALIDLIRQMASSASRAKSRNARGIILTGIGDDCAVLNLDAGQDVLITTDFSLDGIHFRRDWHTPESIGHRCLTRGLSDIAAMGGSPVAAFLSLALPRRIEQAWVNRFFRGFLDLGERYGVTLAGGDTAESREGVLADITVVGSVPHGRTILRSGARPGDKIWVSGELGGSAAAVIKMRTQKKGNKLNVHPWLRHFFPEPRVQLGQTLRKRTIASAMIDTSDGLSTDLAHICEESGVGAEIDSSLIPRARVGRPSHEVALDLALHGGEDYELLFTASPTKRIPRRIAGTVVTQIGEITGKRGIFLRDENGDRTRLPAQGWEHFRC